MHTARMSCHCTKKGVNYYKTQKLKVYNDVKVDYTDVAQLKLQK